MHPALQGALIGIVIGVVLTLFEYSALKRAAKEKAARLHRPEEWGDMERRRVNTVLRFSVILPIGFAIGFWIVWG
jgi:hypothetical protein